VTQLSSSKIEIVQNRGSLLRAKIRDFLCAGKYGRQDKSLLLMAYVDIALEHHEAIQRLIKSQLCGSAFALTRSLFDAVFRALWINACATEKQIQEVANRDDAKFPCMNQMVAMIDQRYSTDKFFTSIKKRSWAAMCSYTHSGLLQITRRFTGDEVKPNYKDGEILEVLNATNIAVLLVSRMFFVSVGHQREADKVEKMMAEYLMPDRRSEEEKSSS
jgi:Family of unknown function (DUF6988)